MRYLAIDCNTHSVTFVWQDGENWDYLVVAQTNKFQKIIPKEVKIIRSPYVYVSRNREDKEKSREKFLELVESTFQDLTNCDCCVAITSSALWTADEGLRTNKIYESINRIWDYADANNYKELNGVPADQIEYEENEIFFQAFPELKKWVGWQNLKSYVYKMKSTQWSFNNHVNHIASCFYLSRQTKTLFEQIYNNTR